MEEASHNNSSTSCTSCTSCISFIVPKELAKTVKSALEKKDKLDRRVKIQPYQGDSQGDHEGHQLVVTSTISLPGVTSTPECTLQIIQELGLERYHGRISIVEEPVHPASDLNQHHTQGNPLHEAFRKGLQQLPEELLASLGLSIQHLLTDLPDAYTIYPPMLLLTHQTFASPSWKRLLAAAPQHHLDQIYATVAASMHVTHIAQNAPIPASSNSPSPSPGPGTTSADPSTTNILRSPTGLAPLHGTFSPPTTTTAPHPSPADFAATLWVSARQNTILQTWAPTHTMFSRGNISEKTRLLRLASVRRAVAEGEVDGRGAAAVDLYAGIGYFAFCYAKAGVKRVLCWELSPWSVEGLVRGAGGNGWGVRVMRGSEKEEMGEGGEEARLLVWRESNVRAGQRIERLRGRVPPIRHVNCGLLPTSRGSWETAVRAVDPGMGGWVHVHENIAVREIDEKAKEILDEIQRIVDRVGEKDQFSKENEQDARKAVLEHVQRVKTYAPGVMHCVLDIWVPPRSSLHGP